MIEKLRAQIVEKESNLAILKARDTIGDNEDLNSARGDLNSSRIRQEDIEAEGEG